MTSADYYTQSYGHFGIHEEMLKDDVRTQSYQRAIMQNADFFRGKVVLDVGSGTGILCMFAAKAGAAHVYGVECSAIGEQAQKIIDINGFHDTITLLRGKVEEIELPCKVDIIISEWMGYCLFYESMLDTVLFARDKWLKPGGAIFPSTASLHIVGIEDSEYRREKIDFWDNVYGFNYAPIKELALLEPLVDVAEPDSVITDDCLLYTVNLATCKVDDLAFQVPYYLKVKRDDTLHAVVTWFDVTFAMCPHPLRFSTAPWAHYTHWKHTVFYLPTPLAVSHGSALSGYFRLRPNLKNHRDLDIDIQYHYAESEAVFPEAGGHVDGQANGHTETHGEEGEDSAMHTDAAEHEHAAAAGAAPAVAPAWAGANAEATCNQIVRYRLR